MKEGILLSFILIIATISSSLSTFLVVQQPEVKSIKAPEKVEILTPKQERLIQYIQSKNKNITRREAKKWVEFISKSLKTFKSSAEPSSKGVTHLITPELFVVLLFRESNFNANSISKANAIGLAQVMPLHCSSLKAAGILERGEKEELLEWNKNIKAGMYILFTYAKGVDSLERALARYNAGPRKEKHGATYAKRILSEYEEEF